MAMKVLSTMGVKGVFDAIVLAHEDVIGTAVTPVFSPTALLLDRIRAGERADAAILTRAGIEALVAEGILTSGTRVDLARSLVGLAVKAGAPKPDISTTEAVRRALLEARSIAYSRNGQSGIYFAQLLERLGIADEVNTKAIVIESGATAAEAAAGRAELAVQQVSELMLVPGADVVGPLPSDIQDDVVFSGATFAGAPHAAEAARMIGCLADPKHAAVYRASGLEPLAEE